MDETIYLLEPVLGAENLDQRFMLLLQACEEQQAFALKPQNKIYAVVATINRRLNTVASRSAGLLLLKTFLTQCSDEIFCEHAVSWMTQCIKGVEKHNKENTEGLAYDTLRMLLTMSSKFPELVKPVCGSVVPRFMEQIQHSQNKKAAVSCLEIILRCYGGPCKTYKNVLERFVLGFVDSEDVELVMTVAQCVSYLPLIGGSGSSGTNHKEAWNKLSLQLCAAANSVLDQLFTNITELHLSSHLADIPSDELLLPEVIEQNPILCAHHLSTRFVNLMYFLCALLCGEFPVMKTIRPDIILALACRGLAVNCSTLAGGVSSEHVALVSILPRLHTSLLHVIQKLVICCGGSLLRYGPLICKLVQQTLKWTSAPNWGYGMEKPYGQLREAACSLLETWLLKVRSASCAELLADQLVPLLLPDAFSTPATITLQVQKLGKKHLTKQQRRHMQQKQQEKQSETDIPEGSARIRLVDSKVNASLCQSSLKALCALMQAAGPFLKPTLHKQVQETVIALLLEVQHASGPDDLPVPYAISGPRLQLYRLLLALVQHPHPHWPAPVHLALKCFSAGQHDLSLEVVGFCTEALSNIRVIVHPSHPSLLLSASNANYFNEHVLRRPHAKTTEPSGKDKAHADTEDNSGKVTDTIESESVVSKDVFQAKRVKYDLVLNDSVSETGSSLLVELGSDDSDENIQTGDISKNTLNSNTTDFDIEEILSVDTPDVESDNSKDQIIIEDENSCNLEITTDSDVLSEHTFVEKNDPLIKKSCNVNKTNEEKKMHIESPSSETRMTDSKVDEKSKKDQSGCISKTVPNVEEDKNDQSSECYHQKIEARSNVNITKKILEEVEVQESDMSLEIDIVSDDTGDSEVLSLKEKDVGIKEIFKEEDNQDVDNDNNSNVISNKSDDSIKKAGSEITSKICTGVSSTSDREIEEESCLGMNAVEGSPHVSEENTRYSCERPDAEGEPVAKIARLDICKSDDSCMDISYKSGDTSDEEELLSSFVDVIAPKAMDNE